MSSFKNLDKIPTWKIQEILNSPNCTGINGKDYGPVKEELQQILWSRQTGQNDRIIEQYWNEYLEQSEHEEAV